MVPARRGGGRRLTSDRDGIIPVAHGHRAHAAMAGSRLEVFARAGHFPHHAEPERFRALREELVATTEPARYDAAVGTERLRTGRLGAPGADAAATA